MAKIYRFTALTSTVPDDPAALDGFDGDLLNHNDLAITNIGGYVYIHILDHDNTSAESLPLVIQPNRNYGTKRWLLKSLACNNLGVSGTLVVGGMSQILGGALSLISANGGFVFENTGAGTNRFFCGEVDSGGVVTRNLFYQTAYGSSDMYFIGDVSALSFTDRTKYPESLQQAYDALASITGKAGKVDHAKMDPFIKGSGEGTRDLGALASCQTAVINDLIARIEKLEKK